MALNLINMKSMIPLIKKILTARLLIEEILNIIKIEIINFR